MYIRQPLSGAPSALHFRTLWDAAERGPVTAGLSGIACSKKCKRMEFCLSEAIKRKDQEFLKDAGSMVLHRDATDGTLLARFQACDSALNIRSGVVGIAKHFGSSAIDISRATGKMYDDFATSLLGAPPRQGQAIVDIQEDRGLAEHLKHITHIINIDAAADEVLMRRRLPADAAADAAAAAAAACTAAAAAAAC